MKHIFVPGKDQNAPTLLLLHGTGGTEEDLLPIAEMMDDRASVLSVRGNVLENGMSRFFRRFAEGVFDIEDLIFRTNELHAFLDQAAKDYGFRRDHMIAIGYSNGANMAGSLMFHHENALRGAILHHPMVPRRDIALPNLAGIPIFIGAGRNDPICPPEETNELQELLVNAGAEVTVHWEHAGHRLTKTEIAAAAQWYAKVFK